MAYSTSTLLREMIGKVASIHLVPYTAERAHLDGRCLGIWLKRITGFSSLFSETSKIFQKLLKKSCQANYAKLSEFYYFAFVFLLKKRVHLNEAA